ncbi:uncharacterized protein LOC136018728 [Lathamus discolor]|uniref:uncharacterized protein LOC136018728 n=1 Tax=Lathamus discolor TaxID=678569 RepID=UPI0032B83654
MTVLVSDTVSAVLKVKGGHWLSPQRFLKYQAIMMEQDDVEIVVTNIVNPASFLSKNEGKSVHRDCLETIEATYSSCSDLKDTPLDDAETWFTDGSSYVVSGKRHGGYAVTTCREVIESGPLPTNTSAQKVELIALTRALKIAKAKNIKIYTDSRYALGVVHAHGAIWKERGLLNSQGKNIKHAQETVRLLEVVQLPEKVAIMHIKAHQKVSSELEEGNELMDREAKEVAKGEITTEGALIPDGKISLEGWPEAFPTRTVKAREETQSMLRTYASIQNKASSHFEVHPDNTQSTVLVYTGQGCVCLRTACAFIKIDNDETVAVKNSSNLCIYNFVDITGCDFSYLAPVVSHQLIKV